MKLTPGMKIVVACDSFKGSLSSRQANEACCAGLADAARELGVELSSQSFEIGDGGEGTAAVLAAAQKGCEEIKVTVAGPLGAPVRAVYYLSADGATAWMDMAAAAGLTLIPACERDPLAASTFGLGQMMADAMARGCRHIVVCCGGSATCDAASGMLEALGYRFYDAAGRQLRACGGSLPDIARIDGSAANPLLSQTRITAVCDIEAPLLGALDYVAQKGAGAAERQILARGLENFYAVALSQTAAPKLCADSRHCGAAGGLSFGLAAVLGAELVDGIDYVLAAIGFDSALVGADLVITGEGSLDMQTLQGKVSMGVLRRSREAGVPVVAIGGQVKAAEALHDAGFSAVLPINPENIELAEAMKPERAMANIRHTAAQFLSKFI